MINALSVLAIIPARGGSKGVPRKNIKNLAGKPLIGWTIDEAKKSKFIDKIVLSSDDQEIISIAEQLGCYVPFIRPKELSSDDTPGIEPVLHAIEKLPEYDVVVLLQPTSPLRLAADIDQCIIEYIGNDCNACVSVTEVDKTPYWMYKVNQKGSLEPLLENRSVLRRQDAPKFYSLNGAIYVSSKENIKAERTFLTDKTRAYIMPKERSFDIDTQEDFLLCEMILKKACHSKSLPVDII
ncbi:acylneuraminate cytidylyltransferase [Anaerobacillus alkalidiazotrophicus]|uniref:Acylneuraminate cytidylyltransferase n=1 Tax=Anaerobacillus alkalidiazotrophicus TaxID=472963 RepID=A0A1S2MCA5_9BACI|nr:acylneuraminate cytidylyltransferase family protein [Anaerobacillus alkalidiazotrophicus]OIJ22378.1 acylneuraminate cytidylyltransferase [Anaerobacillus alkalidiazotrophicus]